MDGFVCRGMLRSIIGLGCREQSPADGSVPSERHFEQFLSIPSARGLEIPREGFSCLRQVRADRESFPFSSISHLLFVGRGFRHKIGLKVPQFESPLYVSASSNLALGISRAGMATAPLGKAPPPSQGGIPPQHPTQTLSLSV